MVKMVYINHKEKSDYFDTQNTYEYSQSVHSTQVPTVVAFVIHGISLCNNHNRMSIHHTKKYWSNLPMLHSHDNVLTSIIGEMKRSEGIRVAAVYHKLKFCYMAGVILYAGTVFTCCMKVCL